MTLRERREQIYWCVEDEYGFTRKMVALEKEIRPRVDPEVWLLIVEISNLAVHQLTVMIDTALA